MNHANTSASSPPPLVIYPNSSSSYGHTHAVSLTHLPTNANETAKAIQPPLQVTARSNLIPAFTTGSPPSVPPLNAAMSASNNDSTPNITVQHTLASSLPFGNPFNSASSSSLPSTSPPPLMSKVAAPIGYSPSASLLLPHPIPDTNSNPNITITPSSASSLNVSQSVLSSAAAAVAAAVNAAKSPARTMNGSLSRTNLGTPLPLRSLVPAAVEEEHKPCNCKKSKCLKLYCICFARQVACKNCNCVCCMNTEGDEHEEIRKKTIKEIKERDPNAFFRAEPSEVVQTPTADGQRSESKHRRGCNCRKSACYNKYCVCYRAGVPCSEACGCTVCKNGGVHQPGQEHGSDGAPGSALGGPAQSPSSSPSSSKSTLFSGSGARSSATLTTPGSSPTGLLDVPAHMSGGGAVLTTPTNGVGGGYTSNGKRSNGIRNLEKESYGLPSGFAAVGNGGGANDAGAAGNGQLGQVLVSGLPVGFPYPASVAALPNTLNGKRPANGLSMKLGVLVGGMGNGLGGTAGKAKKEDGAQSGRKANGVNIPHAYYPTGALMSPSKAQMSGEGVAGYSSQSHPLTIQTEHLNGRHGASIKHIRAQSEGRDGVNGKDSTSGSGMKTDPLSRLPTSGALEPRTKRSKLSTRARARTPKARRSASKRSRKSLTPRGKGAGYNSSSNSDESDEITTANTAEALIALLMGGGSSPRAKKRKKTTNDKKAPSPSPVRPLPHVHPVSQARLGLKPPLHHSYPPHPSIPLSASPPLMHPHPHGLVPVSLPPHSHSHPHPHPMSHLHPHPHALSPKPYAPHYSRFQSPPRNTFSSPDRGLRRGKASSPYHKHHPHILTHTHPRAPYGVGLERPGGLAGIAPGLHMNGAGVSMGAGRGDGKMMALLNASPTPDRTKPRAVTPSRR